MNRQIFILEFTLLSLLFICSPKLTRAQTWEKVNPAGYDYFISASFINDKEGWICSRSGIWPDIQYDLIQTTDGAISFNKVYDFPLGYRADNIQLVDSLNGFALIENYTNSDLYFWSTNDGGHNWVDLTDSVMFTPGGPFYGSSGFYFFNKDVGFCGGFKSIFKTEDGGISWVKTLTPEFIDSASSNNYKPNKIIFINEQYGWATCSMSMDQGFVLKTIDGGAHWIECKPLTGDLHNIHFADSLHGGTTGGDWHYAIVMLTENNFDTISHFYKNKWELLPDAIYYENDSTIWLSGWPANIYKSVDGGATFINYDSSYATDDLTDWIHDFQFFDSTGYAFAYSFILKISNFPNTSLIDFNQTINQIKVTPNPFKDQFRFSLNSSNSQDVLINIMTMDGTVCYNYKENISIGLNNIILTPLINPGIYLLKIVDSSGHVFINKIIKE